VFHSAPEFAEITPELKQKLDQFRDEHANDPLGKVANHILFEDDKLRIWEMKLEPGEHSDLHRHEHDYYLIIFSGDRVAGVVPQGEAMESFVGVVPKAGNTVGIPKGGLEWAWNIGEQTYHEVLVELKNT
jgi:quercetin dioxygenase-like cupin family protein